MSFHAVLAPPAVFHVPPPYEQFEAVPDLAALAPEQLQSAAILAVGVTSPEEAWSEVTELVPRLRARFPAAPVVLRIGRPADGGDAELERRAADLRLRAVVYEGEPPRPRLRRLLTQPADLTGDIVEWLPLRLPGRPAAILELVRNILERSPRFPEVGALLASVDRAERTVRTWFRRAGVPGPGKWLAAGHAIRAALRLQAEDSTPLLALAVECGYSDHSSLSRQCLRLFGVRPGAIRRTLGWEWLMDRWLSRAEGS
jgi:AraC-like DNA-binding protein